MRYGMGDELLADIERWIGDDIVSKTIVEARKSEGVRVESQPRWTRSEPAAQYPALKASVTTAPTAGGIDDRANERLDVEQPLAAPRLFHVVVVGLAVEDVGLTGSRVIDV